MMALAYNFIILFIFVISSFTMTPIIAARTGPPFVFKENTGRIKIIVETPPPVDKNTTSSSPVCPTSNAPREVTYNFSDMGLQTINSEFIKSDEIISLSLDNNNISDISPSAFGRMRNLYFLSISGNRIPKKNILSFKETGRLNTLIIDNNNDKTAVEVLEEYGIFNHLKHLYLRNSQLNNMQIPFNVITPILTNLYLSNNSITFNVVFDNFPWTLTHLHLDRNSINRVEHDKLKHLHELVMDNNAITKVCFECSGESISLRSAVNMRNLFLSGNVISEVSSDAFGSMKHLELLDLSDNKIDNLDNNTFYNMLKIHSLFLANNTLTRVPNVCPMLSLQILNLAGNRIGAVTSDDFKCNNMRHLEYLYLANNDINIIESGAFFYLSKLKYLDLSGNHLTELPTHWAYINTYYSSYNNNDNNNNYRYGNYRFNYRYNGHTNNSHNNYELQSGMQELHLERNNFITLDDISLNGMQTLQHIYLDENFILTFRAKSFHHLSQQLTFHVRNMKEIRTDSLSTTEEPTTTEENDLFF